MLWTKVKLVVIWMCGRSTSKIRLIWDNRNTIELNPDPFFKDFKPIKNSVQSRWLGIKVQIQLKLIKHTTTTLDINY